MAQIIKKCIIVDDDELSRTIVREFVKKTSSLSLEMECENAILAADFLRTNEIDIVFLDVEMPHMSGLELLKTVKNIPAVILITAKESYAVEAFEYEVVDYIVKPISYARFLKSVNKVITMDSSETTENVGRLFVKTDGKFIGIVYREILYFEALGDYVSIVTTHQKYTIHSSLSAIAGRIRISGFCRIHRSYIINLEMINSIEDNTVIIAGRIIPIGSNYKQALFEKLGLT
ncbi:MAG: response regulator transcription factor [Ignavibacteriales bacterium]|nr:response regulator transcription factor [Ignavibacteriales bacterium]